MRSRTLKPGFFKNELLAGLPFETRLLFAGLWLLADRAGRLEDRPKRIQAEIFPYDPTLDVDSMLDQLDQNGFIYRYILNDSSLIQIVHFYRHQSIHPNEQESCISPIPVDLADIKGCREFSRSTREMSRTSPVMSNLARARSEPSCTSEPSCSVVGTNYVPTTPPAFRKPIKAKFPEAISEEQMAWFREFWQLYWRRKAKPAAWKAFRKAVLTEADWTGIRAAVVKQTPEMLRREPDKRPYPATWLNREQWADEEDPQPLFSDSKHVSSKAAQMERI